MKKVLLILGVLAVLVVVGLAVLVGSADAVVKNAVETLGSEATQAPVAVNDVELSLTEGSGAVRGVTVGNPEGFETPSAFELGEIRVVLDTSTVTSDTIVVKEIVIDSPQVTYEWSLGGSNIATIQENVDAFTAKYSIPDTGKGKGKGKKPPSDDTASAPKKDDDGTKLIIEDLRITGGRANVSASFLGGKKLGADLPEVHLTDLGKGEGGITPEELTARIISELSDVVTIAVDALGLDGLAKGVTDAVEDAVDGAVEGVKDLFGK